MKVIAIEVTETTAIVELRPCGLARVLGAATTRVALEHTGALWMTSVTRERLSQIRNGSSIRHALDFRPVAQLPRVTVRR